MTYEERVNAAAKTYADSYNSYDGYEAPKNYTEFQYEGRKVVAMQAAAIREVLNWGDKHKVDEYLRINGYIPEKEEG